MMHKTIVAALLASLALSAAAYADGRVLSVVSPRSEELKEPAKPTQKVAAKKAAKKSPKKAHKKVAAPAKPGEPAVQPIAGGATEQGKPVAAAHDEAKVVAGAAPLAVSEPQMLNLAKPRPDEIAAKAEKPATPNQSYVLFQSKPENAEVVIDGYYAGSTPLELPIRAGNHNLRVIYPGYVEWERKFNAYKGMRVLAILEEKKQPPPSQ